jgi:hypothetical protein
MNGPILRTENPHKSQPITEGEYNKILLGLVKASARFLEAVLAL